LDYTKFDDETLLRLIARAQEEALGALYDRYSRLVYSLALNATGDAPLAEEITQDVFLRVWDKAGTYRVEQSKVTTWITSITRHRAIDMLRRHKVRPEGNRAEWASEASSDLPDGVDVEGEVIHLQRQGSVRKAIATLPVEQRQVLAYAYFRGYSHSEIAAVLKEPLGTVKTRIRLAMQKLRQVLEDSNIAGPPI
jgi:RNA polymerase sigma-70 factor (ECF subfamily)